MAVIRPIAETPATTVLPGDIFLIDGSTGVRALAASVVPLRDANGNVSVNNVTEGFASTTTAGGTTTLTVASVPQQFFTGTLAQTVVLPVTSTLPVLGYGYFFQNGSTGALTIESSGGNVVKIIAPGTSAEITCIALTGTSAASWQTTYLGSMVASGKVVTVNNSLTLAGTDGTTHTFPTTSATLARTDAGQTFSGTQAFGVLTATSINGNTITAGSGILTLAAAKTLTVSNSLTLVGTDGSTLSIGAGGTVAYQGSTLAQFAATTSAQLAGILSDETGTGSAVFANAPTLVNAVVGTQSPGDNTTKAASTAFVTAAVTASVSGVASFNSLTGAVTSGVVKQIFTASGTYTPTAGMLHALIETWGGGAGGGGVASNAGTTGAAGGGGAGSYSATLVTAAAVGASKAVTIGAAGAGGVAGNNAGSAGGDTSVGTLCIAKGGSPGQGSNGTNTPSLGGLGGIAGTGDTTGTGEPGGAGLGQSAVTLFIGLSGKGGSTSIGGGGAQSMSASGAGGNNATGFGAGGSGAMQFNGSGTGSGGNGTAGYVRITEYINL